MSGKLNLRKTTGLAAALAMAGLLPASANAQVWYSEACIQYYTNYCAANWQNHAFTSSAQCVEHYKETVCKGYTHYPDDYLVSPTIGRID